MQRLIVVHNKKSSRAEVAKERIFSEARNLTGFLIGKYEVVSTDVDDNARRLAKILEDGDLVVTIGGDATASIGLNGCLLSGKDVTFSALSFGNFGDTARTLGNLEFLEVIKNFQAGKTKKFYPIQVLVDGKHFRFGAGYVTVGMMAESVEIFNQEKTRKKLKKKKRTEASSYRWLAKWYFKNRKKTFLPGGISDYFAVNGRSVARFMKGKNYCFSKKFQSGRFRLRGIFSLVWFMMRSIVKKIPGEIKEKDRLLFKEKREVTIQMEGESKTFFCQEIELLKEKNIKVVYR